LNPRPIRSCLTAMEIAATCSVLHSAIVAGARGRFAGAALSAARRQGLAAGAFVNASDAGSIGDLRPCADQRPRSADAEHEVDDAERDERRAAGSSVRDRFDSYPVTPASTWLHRASPHLPRSIRTQSFAPESRGSS